LAEFKERNAGRLPELTDINIGFIERTERELGETQREISQLRREKAILQSLAAASEATADGDVDRVLELQREYQRLSAIYSDNHPDLIRVRRELETLGASLDGTTTMDLEAQLAAERQALAEAQLRYTPDHPDIKKQRLSIESLETRLAQARAAKRTAYDENLVTDPDTLEILGRIQSTDSGIQSLRNKEVELRQKLQSYERRLLETPQVEREYQALLRDLDNAREAYEALVAQQKQAQFAEAVENQQLGRGFALVSRPSIPDEPDWPNRIAILLLGLILAAGSGMGVVTAAESVDGSVRSADEFRDLFGSPPIATVPYVRNTSDKRRRSAALAVTAVCVLSIAAVITTIFVDKL
jgi:uncharacterized protein involved in exopolysaccharide biosynthesis